MSVSHYAQKCNTNDYILFPLLRELSISQQPERCTFLKAHTNGDLSSCIQMSFSQF